MDGIDVESAGIFKCYKPETITLVHYRSGSFERLWVPEQDELTSVMHNCRWDALNLSIIGYCDEYYSGQ